MRKEQGQVTVPREVTLSLDDRAHVLRRGDAVVFRADAPQTGGNTGLEPVQLLIVISRA